MAGIRKIAAILVADVVGYSRLAGADEDRTLSRLRGHHRSDLIDPAIDAHHGRIVKRTGDGILIEFRSVVDAVRCAIEVQNGMRTQCGPTARAPYRIPHRRPFGRRGRGGRRRSDGPTASISPRAWKVSAKPGEICLSEDAYRQVKGRLDLAVTDLGPIQLKNIAEADPRLFARRFSKHPRQSQQRGSLRPDARPLCCSPWRSPR